MQGKKLSIALTVVLAMFTVALFVTGTRAVAQEKVIYGFNNNGEGQGEGQFGPSGGMIFDAAGNLYGTTTAGGTGSCTEPTGSLEIGCGRVFELLPKAGGGWTAKVLHSFQYPKGHDGWSPAGSLVFDAAGNLYGTTQLGGTGRCAEAFGNVTGCGTVFELSPTSGGRWTEKALYSFQDSTTDGQLPAAGLIFDGFGNLYGTTGEGGAYYGGTVFELTPAAGGGWTETLVHEFGNGTDGEYPEAGLIVDGAGNLYGTTESGGNYCECGTVFELMSAGGSWTETVLYNFKDNGTDGYNPFAGLALDGAGNLYGATYQGGAYAYGAVFELTPEAGGGWTETLPHSFDYNAKHPKDGAFPRGNVILDGAGNLYGTTAYGGIYSYNGGTVFELTPAAGGGWTEKLLHNFGGNEGDGGAPYSGLILNAAGDLFGTTISGGNYGDGTVFEIKH
jgi:uncharacterized repeat protein (TIGR03803 family)